MECICAFSVSIKVISKTKAYTTCELSQRPMCMHIHTGHRKKISAPKSFSSTPPSPTSPHTYTHTPHALPSPPVLPDRHPVYVHACLWERGGSGGLEKGGTVPIRRLLNTFVSTTHRDEQHRQVAAGRHSTGRCYKKYCSVVRMFSSSQRKRGKGGCHN